MRSGVCGVCVVGGSGGADIFIPNLAAVNHGGVGRASSEAQSGVYGGRGEATEGEAKMTRARANARELVIGGAPSSPLWGMVTSYVTTLLRFNLKSKLR